MPPRPRCSGEIHGFSTTLPKYTASARVYYLDSAPEIPSHTHSPDHHLSDAHATHHIQRYPAFQPSLAFRRKCGAGRGDVLEDWSGADEDDGRETSVTMGTGVNENSRCVPCDDVRGCNQSTGDQTQTRRRELRVHYYGGACCRRVKFRSVNCAAFRGDLFVARMESTGVPSRRVTQWLSRPPVVCGLARGRIEL